MSTVLPPLPGKGKEWWKSLSSEEKHFYMWARFQAGRSNAEIMEEFGLSLGVVSSQRFTSKGKRSGEPTESALSVKEKKERSAQLLEKRLEEARQARGPYVPSKDVRSAFPRPDDDLTAADIRYLEAHLYENA